MSTLPNASPRIEIRGVTKSFAGAPLLQDISFAITNGEIVCLLGPSGSGKTTLLRIIAGLESPDDGDIFFDSQNVRAVPVHLRGFGMMFQDLALFPHKHVFDNVAFGLRMKNSSHAEIQKRVRETLELVGLTEFENRNVNNLSGGEQQRVALARSLAPQPKFLMFDEPLGALDRILREQLVADLRAILKRIQMTALYVTHDQDEAFAIADRIAIIHEGRIVQIGMPEEIYRKPANAFVAQFLGMTNLFAAQKLSDGQIKTDLGTFAIKADKSMVLIRPNAVRVNLNSKGISARIEECIFRAGKYRLRVVADSGARLSFESDQPFSVGSPVSLEIDQVEMIDK
ncbi:MAG: ABC transporter ATP-binding protein [Chloroflexi bacterium]|nr:ABC transporter ATP-binding protein [Chloroflexota bacterium]